MQHRGRTVVRRRGDEQRVLTVVCQLRNRRLLHHVRHAHVVGGLPCLLLSDGRRGRRLGAGDDVQPPAIATLREALARCDALARCRGITYEGTNSTTNATRVYFKTSSGVAHGEGWSTWVKVANVTPPARTIAVGGSSRLELRLRQDFYTVQNLSRVGDLWSFTRPLDTASSKMTSLSCLMRKG